MLLAGTSFDALWRSITLTAAHEVGEVGLRVACRGTSRWSITPPVVAVLRAVYTVASHMTRLSADTADHVGDKVLLLGTIVFAMTNLTTVLARLIFIISECAVQRS